MGLRYNAEMSGAHFRCFFFTLTATAALFVARGHSQIADEHRTFLYPYSLPAVDQGLMSDVAVTLDRAAGSTYVPGRVIVKFRDGASTTARIRSLSLVSATTAVSERPSYANFDLVRIDPSDDAEAVADVLRQRPDVEYARAFRDDLGNLHPALGPVDIPFAAATDLFSSSRFVQPRFHLGRQPAAGP